MNGDYQADGSTSSASLTSSQGNTVTDDDQFAGMDFEHIVDDGPSGAHGHRHGHDPVDVGGDRDPVPAVTAARRCTPT